MKNSIVLLVFVLGCGGFWGCEAMKQAQEKQRAKEREEIEAYYGQFDAVYDQLLEAEPQFVACDDEAIEASKEGRYARSRRRLLAMDLAHLGFVLGKADTPKKWALKRSRDFDELVPLDELDKDTFSVHTDLKHLFEKRYLVLYRDDGSSELDFEGWLFLVDLKEGEAICQVELQSHPSQQRVGAKQSADSVHIKAFERDADKALEEITEHFEVGY